MMMGMRKYAQHMPAKTSPASAPKDQSAILSSPSGLFAFLTAKYKQTAAMTRAMTERTPNTLKRMLSGRGTSQCVH